MLITSSQLYHTRITQNHLRPDPQQIAVLQSLDILSERIQSDSSFLSRLFHRFAKNHNTKQGIYLWGSVGIGKTFLMDCFYDALPSKRKRRCHFYAFMRELHTSLREHSGKQDPLQYIAKKIHSAVDVLCFDEFFVKDIVDAMLFGELLPVLFQLGVFFVATSNVEPGNLYKNGLQRQNFFPTIHLLQEKCEVIHLSSIIDYRLRHLQAAGVYYTPLNEQTQECMLQAFHLYEPSFEDESIHSVEILERQLAVIKVSSEAVWFDFSVLCGKQRCQQDYLILSQQYPMIFLSNVPILMQCDVNDVTRFIQLVDILYDAKIKLVISAAVLPKELYTQGDLAFEFQRTVSRLIEMQSTDYFNATATTH